MNWFRILYFVTMVLGIAGCLYAIIVASINEIKKCVRSEISAIKLNYDHSISKSNKSSRRLAHVK